MEERCWTDVGQRNETFPIRELQNSTRFIPSTRKLINISLFFAISEIQI